VESPGSDLTSRRRLLAAGQLVGWHQVVGLEGQHLQDGFASGLGSEESFPIPCDDMWDNSAAVLTRNASTGNGIYDRRATFSVSYSDHRVVEAPALRLFPRQ